MPGSEILKKAAIYLLAAALALSAGFYFGLSSRTEPPAPEAESALDALVLQDLQGKSRHLAEWRGKPLILNFWATWCAPCREEMPLLDRWQQKNAINVLGIALDNAENVAKFREQVGVRFPLLLGGAELIDLMKTLGNRSGGLPFTLFLDAQGHVLDSHLGPLDAEKLEKARQLLQTGTQK